MNSVIIGLLAETFIHPGSGQSEGVIDLPVAREAATDYPFIAGSSLKGSLRDRAEQLWDKDSNPVKTVFGEQENAGEVLVSDARLLLLPVRSLSSAYKWVTCPHLLERLKRDLCRSGNTADWALPKPESEKAIASGKGKLFLEERVFELQSPPDENVIEALKNLMAHDSTRERLNDQLVVLHDDDFVWFARYGLAVQARNALDNKTKTTKSGALWYEETLPPDTLMYAILSERKPDVLSQVGELFKKPYLQAGGNETVGQGWFAVQWLNGGTS